MIVNQKIFASLPGFEPGTFGLEVQRAIHCATGTATLIHPPGNCPIYQYC